MRAWRAIAGPLAWPGGTDRLIGLGLVVLSTALTEVGGLLIWPALGIGGALGLGRGRTTLLAITTYAVGSLAVAPIAAQFGRVPLPCLGSADLAPRSAMTCVLHRHYVRPALRTEVDAVAARYAAATGDRVRYLDAGFPFRGLPLLPHLSHHDGRKLDVALPGRGGSPIGYFGYVAPTGPPACPPRWIDLRWDFAPLQPAIALDLDVDATTHLVRAIVDRRAVGKVLLEPHVEARLTVASDKVRFQGCHAARHDDHLHLQLR